MRVKPKPYHPTFREQFLEELVFLVNQSIIQQTPNICLCCIGFVVNIRDVPRGACVMPAVLEAFGCSRLCGLGGATGETTRRRGGLGMCYLSFKRGTVQAGRAYDMFYFLEVPIQWILTKMGMWHGNVIAISANWEPFGVGIPLRLGPRIISGWQVSRYFWLDFEWIWYPGHSWPSEPKRAKEGSRSISRYGVWSHEISPHVISLSSSKLAILSPQPLRSGMRKLTSGSWATLGIICTRCLVVSDLLNCRKSFAQKMQKTTVRSTTSRDLYGVTFAKNAPRSMSLDYISIIRYMIKWMYIIFIKILPANQGSSL